MKTINFIASKESGGNCASTIECLDFIDQGSGIYEIEINNCDAYKIFLLQGIINIDMGANSGTYVYGDTTSIVFTVQHGGYIEEGKMEKLPRHISYHFVR